MWSICCVSCMASRSSEQLHGGSIPEARAAAVGQASPVQDCKWGSALSVVCFARASGSLWVSPVQHSALLQAVPNVALVH